MFFVLIFLGKKCASANFYAFCMSELLQEQKLGKEKGGGSQGKKGRDEHDAGGDDDDDNDNGDEDDD